MKKLFVFIAIIAVAAMAAVSCNKQEDPAITKVKVACIGDWEGEVGEDWVTVTFSPTFKITTDGNFTAQITGWTVKSGTVWAELDNDAAKTVAIEISGVKMKLTTNNAELAKVLPTELSKMLE